MTCFRCVPGHSVHSSLSAHASQGQIWSRLRSKNKIRSSSRFVGDKPPRIPIVARGYNANLRTSFCGQLCFCVSRLGTDNRQRLYIVLAVQQWCRRPGMAAQSSLVRPGPTPPRCYGCLGLATPMPPLAPCNPTSCCWVGWAVHPPHRRLSHRRLPSDVLPCASSLA
jgi:hypothetical protein